MNIIFAIAAVVSIVSAVMVIMQRNPVYSALFLVLTLLCVATFYLLQDAQFLAAVQIVVYAGAIMVLFLFVVTLLSPGREVDGRDRLAVMRLPAVILAVALTIILAVTLGGHTTGGVSANLPTLGTVEVVGQQLFTAYLFPFEVTSFLLLVAMVGAIVLAKRRLD